jgi:hypothetical protein
MLATLGGRIALRLMGLFAPFTPKQSLAANGPFDCPVR